MTKTVQQCFAAMLVLAASSLCMASPAFAGPVAIVNGTRTVMMSLQVKGPRTGWRGNVLRDGPLGVQKQATIFVPSNACICDLKATFEDGHRVMHPQADLCGRVFVFRDF
jgi:hypothetical protein